MCFLDFCLFDFGDASVGIAGYILRRGKEAEAGASIIYWCIAVFISMIIINNKNSQSLSHFCWSIRHENKIDFSVG